MIYLVSTALALVCAASAILWKSFRWTKQRKFNPAFIYRHNPHFSIATPLLFLGIALSGAFFVLRFQSSTELFFKLLTLVFGIYLIAYVDYREHIIPNRLLLILALVRLGFLVYELAAVLREDLAIPKVLRLVLLSPLLGGLIAGGILLLTMLLSRKGIGFGDVKLFFVLGLFAGSSSILPLMLYTFVFSALGGFAMLVLKKAKLKDVLPMAPFALLGCLAHLAISIVTEG